MTSTRAVRFGSGPLALGAALALALAGCDQPMFRPRGPTDVLGWIRDQRGLPVEDARVRIGASVTYTGREGFFRVPDVTVPYDLVIEEPGTTVFVGLRNVDPQITLQSSGFRAAGQAWVTGRVPWQESARTIVFLFGPGMDPVATAIRDVTGTYLMRPTWGGPEAQPRVSLFMMREERRVEWLFEAYATRAVRLSDGGRFVVDVDDRGFRPVVPRAVDVEFSYPQGMTHAFATLGIPFAYSGHYAITGRDIAASGQPVTLQVPAIAGLPLQVVIRAQLGSGYEWSEARVPLADLSSVRVEFRPPPLLSAPADSARVPADAALEWTDSRIGAYAVHVIVEGRDATVFTDQPRVALASVPVEGGFPPGARCWWYVEALSAATYVDDLVAWPGTIAVRNLGWTRSAPRAFTIATNP